jgi:hypothetical protein
MTKKFHIFLFILTFGFFVTPNMTYACGTKSTKTEKSCCKKDNDNKDNKKNCSKNHNSKNEKNNDGCGGENGQSSCHCSTTNCAFALSFWTETKTNTYFPEFKKCKSYYIENYHSDGFYSIWTPPNIG